MKYFTMLFVGCLITFTIVNGQVPQKISYQGLLTTSSGIPLQDGSYDLRFDIYNMPSTGTLRHTETHSGVTVERGTFSLNLGPLPSIFSESLFIEVTVLAGPDISSPMTFAPRSELTSAPYAFRADTARYALNSMYADTATFARNVPPSQWTTSGGGIYYDGGNVGIGGTASTVRKLDVYSDFDGLAVFYGTNTNTGTNAGAGLFLQSDNSYNGGLYQASSNFNLLPYLPNGGRGMLILSNGGTSNGIAVTTGVTGRPIIFSDNAEVMRIQNGNVGIGTTTPNAKLDVSGPWITNRGQLQITGDGAGAGLTIYNGTTLEATFLQHNADWHGINDNALRIGTVLDKPIDIFSNNANAVTILGSGNVGIGTTTPDANAKLDVNGYAFAKAPVVVYDSAAGSGTSFDVTWMNDARVDNNLVEKQPNNYEFKLKKAGLYRVDCRIRIESAGIGDYPLWLKIDGGYKDLIVIVSATPSGIIVLQGWAIVHSNGNNLLSFEALSWSSDSFSIYLPNSRNTSKLSIQYLGAE